MSNGKVTIIQIKAGLIKMVSSYSRNKTKVEPDLLS